MSEQYTVTRNLKRIEVLSSTMPFLPSDQPLLEPTKSWLWPITTDANLSEPLRFLQPTPGPLKIRMVIDQTNCYLLAAYRSPAQRGPIPPYPGLPPCIFPDEPRYGFIDGSLGRFDFRRYPQVFDEQRPWLPFVLNPNNGLDNEHLEYHCPLTYWSSTGWDQSFIDALLTRHLDVMIRVAVTIKQRNRHGHKWLKSKFKLPTMVKIGSEHIASADFATAVQLIGNTQRYIAEISAVLPWLETEPWPKNPKVIPDLQQMPDHRYQGCWLRSKILPPHFEETLIQGAVPVYILMKIRPVDLSNIQCKMFDFANLEDRRELLVPLLQKLGSPPQAPTRPDLPTELLSWPLELVGQHLPPWPPEGIDQEPISRETCLDGLSAFRKEWHNAIGPWGYPTWAEDEPGTEPPTLYILPHVTTEYDGGIPNVPPAEPSLSRPSAPRSKASLSLPTRTVPTSAKRGRLYHLPSFRPPPVASSGTSHMSSTLSPQHTPSSSTQNNAHRLPIQITSADGKLRPPAIVGPYSEALAFDLPLTPVHPLMSQMRLPPGSHWYRYCQSSEGKPVVHARPRNLELDQDPRFEYLFVWPNPKGGGYIFFLSSAPIPGQDTAWRICDIPRFRREEDDVTMEDLFSPVAPATPPLTPRQESARHFTPFSPAPTPRNSPLPPSPPCAPLPPPRSHYRTPSPPLAPLAPPLGRRRAPLRGSGGPSTYGTPHKMGQALHSPYPSPYHSQTHRQASHRRGHPSDSSGAKYSGRRSEVC
jgi:hypothetical protein